MIANTLKIVAFLFTGVVTASAMASDSVPTTTEVKDAVESETAPSTKTEKTEADLDREFQDLKQKQEEVKLQLEQELFHESVTNQQDNTTEVVPVARKVESEPEGSSCHPNYSGCLDINASDYDCEGGSGNGPKYTGAVQVYGGDPFDLDRDNDGWGCE